ncbi:cholesterol transporter ABCA5-like [Oppia nitens]|uniref:cholesterol transporter ABCA5-like n=1 Tax=Oppia nitens TaxID=1686743 RepID=UPI0023DC63DB|nr:cholesterol transporter ABCA5-like [Oppia nitens]
MQMLIPSYLCMTFMPLVSILTVMFVVEKQRKIKEAMFMMGLTMTVYWVGWITVQSIIICILSAIITAILYIAGTLTINPVIIFLLMFMFGTTLTIMAAIWSPLFNKEETAASFSSIFTLLAGGVYILLIYIKVSPVVQYLLALISPVAFTLGVQAMLRIDSSSDSVFGNLFDDPVFSLGSALLMLLVDIVLYTFLAIYLDQVIPGEFGPKQSICFFLKKSFWFPSTTGHTKNPSNEEFTAEHNSNVEEISKDLLGKSVINIKNLTKVYGNGKKAVAAVNDLSFSVYESQITGLLGHNGAGKSTLINMLVGNIQPTSGTGYIYGHNITDSVDMYNLRKMFGVCLQQDILFDDLTAIEHLEFFAQIKGIDTSKMNSEIKKLLTDLQLYENRDIASVNLSGGQKRKLCVAIALIADPKIIILDEPSSGVDPYSRRQIWSILQSYKKNRVIILSTHFMDEADLLADRKAIIAKGKLRCCGSSLFLKKRFGIGYHLTVDIKKDTPVDSVNQLVVNKNIPKAQLERQTDSEMFYLLPPSETQLFPKLFESLEQNSTQPDGFVKSFGISMSSLEEVFLKIGEDSESKPNTTDKQNNSSSGVSTATKPTSLEMIDVKDLSPNFFQTFIAYLKIRVMKIIRNPVTAASTILSPLFIIMIGYFVSRYFASDDELKPLLLKPTIYGSDKRLAVLNNTGHSMDNTTFISLINRLDITPKFVTNFSLPSMTDTYMAVDVTAFQNASTIKWDFLYNDTYIHSLPILQNLMTNLYYSYMSSNKTTKMQSINTYSYPLSLINSGSNLFNTSHTIYILLLGLVFLNIAPILAADVVEDREFKIKSLLRVFGLGISHYWTATLVGHLLIYSLTMFCILILVTFVLKVNFLVDSEAIICFIIMILLFMPASLLACYVWIHMFDKRDLARAFMPLISIMPTYFCVFIMGVCIVHDVHMARVFHQIFCFIWPFYVPFGFLLYLASTKLAIVFLQHHGYNDRAASMSYFDWDKNIDITFIGLIFTIIVYTIALVIVDKLKTGESFQSALGFGGDSSTLTDSTKDPAVRPSDKEDNDVKQERLEVNQYLTNNNSISQTKQTKIPIVLLNGLHKKYWECQCCKCRQICKTAVQNMSLLLESGNIFGLLGPNGAGKSTALKIIICEEQATSGQVFIAGNIVKASDQHVFQQIGYCPQHDSLWADITVREHMYLIAAIRGIPNNKIKLVCDSYIENMKISEHYDKKVEHLSGGTKRKLCYLMSLLGRPKLVLLDEPSTGMDPKAKRFLWSTILSTFERNTDRSAVLTTHSMEEADALCTRLAIMIKGVVRCIGSVQHLKNKYGAGYVLEIKWVSNTTDHTFGQKLKQTIESFFTNISLKEEYNNRLIYDIPQQSVQSLSKIFSFLENLRQSMSSIEEYSFSQKTIEQIFIDFAKEQEIND